MQTHFWMDGVATSENRAFNDVAKSENRFGSQLSSYSPSLSSPWRINSFCSAWWNLWWGQFSGVVVLRPIWQRNPNIWWHWLSSLQFSIFWVLLTNTTNPDDQEVKVWESQLKLICELQGGANYRNFARQTPGWWWWSSLTWYLAPCPTHKAKAWSIQGKTDRLSAFWHQLHLLPGCSSPASSYQADTFQPTELRNAALSPPLL